MITILLLSVLSVEASGSTLEAGLTGYKLRAESIRKKAVAKAERSVAFLSTELANVRKARLDPTLVGTRDAAGVANGSVWRFGTNADKAVAVARHDAALMVWKAILSQLRSKKLSPQIVLPLTDGVTPGAVGVPYFRYAILEVPDKSSMVLSAPALRVEVRDDVPHVSHDPKYYGESEVIIYHGGSMTGEVGDRPNWTGLYQFTGIDSASRVVLRRTNIDCGDIPCFFNSSGDFIGMGLEHPSDNN